MTDEQLANLRRLADAATPGPWEFSWSWQKPRNKPEHEAWSQGPTHSGGGLASCAPQAEDDARFIVAARDAVPALLDDLAAMTQRAERAEADARVLRTLVRTATIRYAVETTNRDGFGDVAATMAAYLDALFEAAGDNGAFAADGCDLAAVVRVAESVGASTDDLPEAQP
jgi:hypothetical protein